MRIDRCYCFQKRFAVLKRVAKKTGVRTLTALQCHVEFGSQCKLCHPYVECMLRNGQTVFTEILSKKKLNTT